MAKGSQTDRPRDKRDPMEIATENVDREVFSITVLDRIFSIHGDRTAAISACVDLSEAPKPFDLREDLAPACGKLSFIIG